MSRKHKIRWQETDKQELARAVKNFNAKISRIEKKYPELKNALPEKMKVGELKDLINTRQDLKREINSLKRFTDVKNRISLEEDGTLEGIEIYGDYNIKITKWQKKEINRRIATINTRRKKRLEALKDVPVTSRGEEQGYTVGQQHIGVGSVRMNDLAPMTGLTKGASEESVKRKFKSALIQSQSDFLLISDYRLKSSYITSLYRNFSIDNVKDIIEQIEKMPVDEFLRIYNSDNDAKFEGTYPGNAEQEREYAESLRAVWLPKR